MKDPQALAKSLVLDIANSGFALWQGKDFRSLVDFDKLSQTEQDRIFNEIEVTGIGLLVLYLDSAISEIVLTEHQRSFDELREASINFYIDYLTEIGVPKKFVKIWRQLIDMRTEEYRQDYQTALKESVNWKEFQGDLKLRKMWAQIETLAIDGLHHIRRGKTKTNDPLWKLLRFWLLSIYKRIADQRII